MVLQRNSIEIWGKWRGPSAIRVSRECLENIAIILGFHHHFITLPKEKAILFTTIISKIYFYAPEIIFNVTAKYYPRCEWWPTDISHWIGNTHSYDYRPYLIVNAFWNSFFLILFYEEYSLKWNNLEKLLIWIVVVVYFLVWILRWFILWTISNFEPGLCNRYWSHIVGFLGEGRMTSSNLSAPPIYVCFPKCPLVFFSLSLLSSAFHLFFCYLIKFKRKMKYYFIFS